MSDWQVGDLALCIKRDPWHFAGTREVADRRCPKFNEVCLVEYVVSNERGGYLLLSGFKGIWAQFRFRKIRPSAIEHIEALKRLPVEVKEDA